MFAYVTSRKGYRAGGLNAPKFAGGLVPYQEFDPTANDPAQGSINVNVGDTRIQGAEMELLFMPSADLTLSASATYQDTKTTKYNVPPVLSGFFPANEVPFFYAPQKTATLGARYMLPVEQALGYMVLNANFYFSDKVDMIQYQAASYKITNLRADSLSIMGSSVDVGLFVNNVFDEEAVVAPGVLSSTAPVGTAIYNPPRMWGMEVQYRFGVN